MVSSFIYNKLGTQSGRQPESTDVLFSVDSSALQRSVPDADVWGRAPEGTCGSK